MSTLSIVEGVESELAAEFDGRRPTPWEVHDWMSARRPKPEEGVAAMLAFHRENARMYGFAGAPRWVEREEYLARQVLRQMGGGEGADAAGQDGT